MQNAIIAFKN